MIPAHAPTLAGGTRPVLALTGRAVLPRSQRQEHVRVVAPPCRTRISPPRLFASAGTGGDVDGVLAVPSVKRMRSPFLKTPRSGRSRSGRAPGRSASPAAWLARVNGWNGPDHRAVGRERRPLGSTARWLASRKPALIWFDSPDGRDVGEHADQRRVLRGQLRPHVGDDRAGQLRVLLERRGRVGQRGGLEAAVVGLARARPRARRSTAWSCREHGLDAGSSGVESPPPSAGLRRTCSDLLAVEVAAGV